MIRQYPYALSLSLIDMNRHNPYAYSCSSINMIRQYPYALSISSIDMNRHDPYA